jgi:poly-beta-1,6-N-acetyl-D-glucosamine synthase
MDAMPNVSPIKMDAMPGASPISSAELPPIKYCIITPIRDEEEFIAGTIGSVLEQTIRPAEWIIVNDGSTDRTSEIIDSYARKYPWIRTLHRENRGYRTTGGGVDAFLTAYELLECRDWDYLVNLDGDLGFDPGYFEKCFDHFAKSPKLGIGGGTIYNKIGDKLVLETTARFHVRGATKVYRRQCWEDIGGLLRGLGWDTVDEIKANMLGWTTGTFPELKVIHYRVTGIGWGKWGGSVKDGRADYIVGYHPLFFAAKCASRLFRRPYILGSIGMAYGFLQCYVRHAPRVEDKPFVRYIRRQQLRRLFGLQTIWR